MTRRHDDTIALVAVLTFAVVMVTIAGFSGPSPGTTTITVARGPWHAVVRAVNQTGLESGNSNEVAGTCTADACQVRLSWDPNVETDLTHYRVLWGPATRVYLQSLVVPAGDGAPRTLPAPTLRIRRAE